METGMNESRQDADIHLATAAQMLLTTNPVELYRSRLPNLTESRANINNPRDIEENQGGNPQAVADAHSDALIRTLMVEYNRLENPAIFAVSFVVLVAVKLLFDYIVRLSLLVSLWYGFRRVKDVIEVELALGSRVSIRTLLSCCVLNFVVLSAMCLFLELLGYSEDLRRHLLLGIRTRDAVTLTETIWNCLVMDVFMQLVAQQLRVSFCLATASLKEPEVVRAMQLLGLFQFVQRLVGQAGIASRVPQKRSVDVERGLNPNGLHHRGGETSGLPSNEESDDYESSTDETESCDYSLRIKVCKCIDIVSYLYRSLLPVPLWLRFFKNGWGSSFNVFALAYVLTKCFDSSWKLKGGFHALDHIIFNKLEYGHHSTPDECDQNEGIDCPVCFEAPSKPITLDCKHIFCAVCIGEWLDKEKTCPVCRAEVKSVVPFMSDVRRRSSSTALIIA